MADDKPKHKPQKKRTLEDVLKSLQDLIRSDLVSARTAAETSRHGAAASEAADEPDTFHDALHQLDQIITEKIIEPVERARETPPEPLLPDEELEISWNPPEESAPPEAPVAPDGILVETLDTIAWDTDATSPPTEIEAAPPPPSLASREAPPDATEPPPVEQPATVEQPPPAEIAESITLEEAAPPPPSPTASPETPPDAAEPSPIQQPTTVEQPPPTEIAESITLEYAEEPTAAPEPSAETDTTDEAVPAPSETTETPEFDDGQRTAEPAPTEQPPPTEIAESTTLEYAEEPTAAPEPSAETDTTDKTVPALSETTETPEFDDGQRMFDFDLPDIDAASPAPAPVPPAEPVQAEPAEPVQPEPPPAATHDVVADENIAPANETPAAADAAGPEAPDTNKSEEQANSGAVEREHSDADNFVVEFTLTDISAPAKPAQPEIESTIAPPSAPEPGVDTPTDLTEPISVNDSPDTPPPGNNAPPEKTDSTATPPERTAATGSSPGTEEEIPVLKEVADLHAPPAPPLPDVAQAREIAIRVIARLNIERRRAGETPLDIRTIERLQQYLADALSKRALNKPP